MHTHCFCQKYKHTTAGHCTPPLRPATPQLPNPNSFNTPQHCAHSSSIPSPIQQPRQQSPPQTNINPSTQSFIPAAATHTTVSSTPEQRIPKSLNGEKVKNNRQQGRSNAQDEQLCFCCKQPGHLKKDCPEPHYCSKCRTKGHIPAKCPAKNQNSRPVDKGQEFQGDKGNENRETCREEWKRAQDQPRFSNRNNRCLNCAGDHQTDDCPTRKQHWAPTTSNPASSTGIYQNHDQFQNISLNHNSPQQQQPKQSQSTVGVTTPTMIVNNPQVQPVLHAQPQQINQQPPYQVRPPLNQPFIPQVNPLLTPPQAFNTQVLPPYFPQYPPSNSPSVGSTNSFILIALQKQWERQEQVAREANKIKRQKEERKRMKEEHKQRKEERKKTEKKEIQQCNRFNKSFKKIPRFDGSVPHYCFD